MKIFIKYFLLKLLCVIISIFLLDGLLHQFFLNYHKRTKTDLHNLNYDAVFFGSSRCIHHIKPVQFKKITGLSTFNMGWAGSGSAEIYAAIKIYLEFNRTPKIIFIQIDDYTHNNREISTLASQPLLKYYNSKIISDYFNSYSDKLLNVPLLKYLKYRDIGWREILKTLFKNNLNYDQLGFVAQNGNTIVTESKIKINNINLTQNIWIDKSIDLCRNKKIQVVLFTSPIYRVANSNNLNIFSNIYHCTYYNFADSLQSKKYYYDATHLNELGADSFTQKLSKKFMRSDRH